MKTEVIKKDYSFAADVIKNGGLVALPTETVYGLAADGLNADAVEKVYEAKGRPDKKPVSLFVTDMSFAEKFCKDIPEAAYKLADKFWPGPLTMILFRKSNVPDIITSGGEKVGIRCPKSEAALELIKITGTPLTGTSANISGNSDAVAFEEVMDYFEGKIECAVDGGICEGGVPSTVVDMTEETPKIIRLGSISECDIAETIHGKMTVIGITGGTGAGKTTTLDVICDLGGCVIDCDAVYHGLLRDNKEMMSELRERFPGAFLEGQFDRKALGKIVFASQTELEALNTITAKYVMWAVKEILAKEHLHGRTLAAIDAIGLFEGELDSLCDFTIAVTASQETRINRIMQRENISREYAQLRVSAQKSAEYFEEKCDYSLRNDFDTKEEFKSVCEDFFAKLLRSM